MDINLDKKVYNHLTTVSTWDSSIWLSIWDTHKYLVKASVMDSVHNSVNDTVNDDITTRKLNSCNLFTINP